MNLGSKSGNLSFISNSLLELSQDNDSALNRNFIGDEDDSRSNINFVTNEDDTKVAIRITAEDVSALEPQLAQYNFQTIASAPDHHFIEGFIDPGSITELAALKSEGLMGVLPVYQPITNVGEVTSQADFVHESDRVRAALPVGFDGTGVTVGIMANSYNVLGGADADVASGDLPDGVNVIQEGDPDGAGIFNTLDEGRAMLQLVYDMAPDADLAFSSVLFGPANFAQQIRNLADPDLGNADVLVDDVTYLTDPFFQDGIIAQAVDEVVTTRGVPYFAAAANFGDSSFESSNINFVEDSSLFDGSFYDFDPGAGVDITQGFTLNPGEGIALIFQWDDPFFTADGVDTDLDIFAVDSAGNIVDSQADGSGMDDNIASQTPLEIYGFLNDTDSPQTYDLYINKFAGPDPGRIKYINIGDTPTDLEYPIEGSTIVGQPAAVNAQAVGAVAWYDQDNPENLIEPTSQGPTTILFEPDGTRLAEPEIRQTPDIAAITGTNTTFFGFDIDEDDDEFPNFFGTSAAAPHAAAVAALLLDADPTLTPDQIYTRLQTTAEDIGEPGFDNLTGNGLINAYDAIFGFAVAADLNFMDDFEDGDLPIAYETDSTGAGRIQVTEDNDPIGTKHLTLDSAADGTGALSLNEVILHVDASESDNVVLSFDQREFDDFDDPMSESFVGSENSDGVALSVDGNTWYRLVSLTGDNSTNTYSTKTFNLGEVADANGLTLGGDVQIKFQQFDEFEIPRNGMAFDNISVTENMGGGNEGDNLLEGTRGDDNLLGTDANDFIRGNLGNDTLNGGAGNDTIQGGLGGDEIRGGAGDDLLAADQVGRFNDYGGSFSFLGGEEGNDTIFGGRKNDFIRGGDGLDELYGKRGDDLLLGQSGDDLLNGGLGDDVLEGGDGNDTADYSDLNFNGVFGTVAGLDVNLDNISALHSSTNNPLTWTDTIRNIENVTGTRRNDRFIGDSQDNIFDGQGQVGRDDRQTVFTSQDGSDYSVIGDVVEYSGSQTEFSFNGSADNFTVSGNGEGTDTLIDIEFIRFNAESNVIATSDLDFG